MLPKNKPQRQTAGWGLLGTGEGGDCFMNQASFVVMRLFWNKIRAVVAPWCGDTSVMELFTLKWVVLCSMN